MKNEIVKELKRMYLKEWATIQDLEEPALPDSVYVVPRVKSVFII